MLLFNSPLSAAKADQLISIVDLPPGGRILDVGCGSGAFLIRVVEAKEALGIGIDRNTESINAARTAAAIRCPESLQFQAVDFQTMALPDASFDLAMCIGSTHAFGTGEAAYPNAILGLTRLVRPGGLILVGDGYWKQPPSADYIALIGDPVGIYRTHAENIWFAEQSGLIPWYATTSNDDEWDHFEWSHRIRIEIEGAQHPEDPESKANIQRSRAWRDGYLRWGRSTMGFGFYLFRKPYQPEPPT